MRIVMIGATGSVGSLLTERLLADEMFEEVHAIARRASGRTHARWREHVAAPEDWPRIVAGIGADRAVSTLGTTIRVAGSEAAFRAVDRDMVARFGRAARDAGARHMLTISSVGADARSRNFYLSVKGEMEDDLTKMSFDRLDVLRPGLLRGERGGDRRLAERIGIALSPLTNLFLRGPLARYAAIDATRVADAAATYLRRNDRGRFVHENGSMLQSPLFADRAWWSRGESNP